MEKKIGNLKNQFKNYFFRSHWQTSSAKGETQEHLSSGITKPAADIDVLAVQETQLTPLIELFSEEASAEELCKLL